MLNYFYWYSIIWSLMLVLSLFHWSTFNSIIDERLLIFVVFTIAVCLGLGFIFRKKFKFKKIDFYPRHNKYITPVLCVLMLLDYLACGQIPLFSILLKTSYYKSFSGIPLIHPLIVTFSQFYMQYLFYIFICFPKRKKLLKEYIVLFVFVLLFQYNRGGMFINLFCSALMLLASKQESIKKKLYKKNVIMFFLFVILGLYVFGGLGNLRHGGTWNDSSYIFFYGQISNYPKWLPTQFAWSYLYITTSLNNLNLSILSNSCKPSFAGYLGTFFPDFISKRLFGDSIVATNLIDINFNTATCYSPPYMNGGIIGMYFQFIYIIALSLLIIFKFRGRKDCHMITLAFMNIIFIFMFFTPTLSVSSISFPIAYSILSVFVPVKKKYISAPYFYRELNIYE